ncbi:hypothetical protein PENSPDRAFT_672573 [Peniophora sp. CONT]|nr:hypothetical protein PENSPDRAFT_672573 [Peniophora sp. CONT]
MIRVPGGGSPAKTGLLDPRMARAIDGVIAHSMSAETFKEFEGIISGQGEGGGNEEDEDVDDEGRYSKGYKPDFSPKELTGMAADSDANQAGSSDDDEVVQVVDCFDIEFRVPVGKMEAPVEGVTSQSTFADVVQAISGVMGVSSHALSLGYVFSFLSKTPKPKPALWNANGWSILVCDACAWREKNLAKKKPMVPPWYVTMQDMSDGSKAKSADATAKELKASQVAAVAGRDALELELLRRIDKEMLCSKHNHQCVLHPTGGHYNLTMNNKQKWVHLVADEHGKEDPQYTIEECPFDALNIADGPARQASIRTRMPAPSTPQAGGSGTDHFFDAAAGFLERFASGSSVPTSLPARPAASLAPPEIGSAHSTPTKKHLRSIVWPALPNWLKSLDSDVSRSQGGMSDYLRYEPAFARESMHSLGDLRDVTVAELKAEFGVTFGDAKQLLKFVEEDVTEIEREAKKACT